jgi:predicted anti-sigma-YlaC factor YlaD
VARYLMGACENGEVEVIETHLEMCASCRQLARKLAAGQLTKADTDHHRPAVNAGPGPSAHP